MFDHTVDGRNPAPVGIWFIPTKKKKKHYLQCFIVTVYGCQLVQGFATIHSMKPSPGRQLPASHPCDSYPWPQQRCWEAPCNVHNSDMNMMIWVVL